MFYSKCNVFESKWVKYLKSQVFYLFLTNVQLKQQANLTTL